MPSKTNKKKVRDFVLLVWVSTTFSGALQVSIGILVGIGIWLLIPSPERRSNHLFYAVLIGSVIVSWLAIQKISNKIKR